MFIYADVAIMLLQKYLERFFKKKKAEWEKDKLEYVELTYNEFIKSDSYNIEINANQHSIIENISELKKIKAGATFSASLINALVRGINSFLDVGRYFGSSIRRFIGGNSCPLK